MGSSAPDQQEYLRMLRSGEEQLDRSVKQTLKELTATFRGTREQWKFSVPNCRIETVPDASEPVLVAFIDRSSRLLSCLWQNRILLAEMSLREIREHVPKPVGS